MTTQTHSAAPDLPVDMIIFGGGGDLSARKLLPALYMAHLHGKLPKKSRILAIGRQDWTRERYLEFVETHSRPFVDVKSQTPEAWQAFLAIFEYVRVDVTSAEDYARLASVSAGN